MAWTITITQKAKINDGKGIRIGISAVNDTEADALAKFQAKFWEVILSG